MASTSPVMFITVWSRSVLPRCACDDRVGAGFLSQPTRWAA